MANESSTLLKEYNMLEEKINDLEMWMGDYNEKIEEMYDIVFERAQKINELVDELGKEYLKVGFEIKIEKVEDINRKIEELRKFERNLFLSRLNYYFEKLDIKPNSELVENYLLMTDGRLIVSNREPLKEIIGMHYEIEKEKGIDLSILYQDPVIDEIKKLKRKKSNIAKKLNKSNSDERFEGYFLNENKIENGELELGKEYIAVEFFDGNKIVNIKENDFNRYKPKRMKVMFFGVIKNQNGDELYNLGNEKVNKNYVLFEKI